MHPNTEPRVRRIAGKKIAHGIARNRQRETSRRHRVDADHAATCIRKGSAGIARREADSSLHPRLRANPAQRSYRANDPGGESTDETKRIANGNDWLTGTNLRRVGHGRSGKVVRRNAQGGKIASPIS